MICDVRVALDEEEIQLGVAIMNSSAVIKEAERVIADALEVIGESERAIGIHKFSAIFAVEQDVGTVITVISRANNANGEGEKTVVEV